MQLFLAQENVDLLDFGLILLLFEGVPGLQLLIVAVGAFEVELGLLDDRLRFIFALFEVGQFFLAGKFHIDDLITQAAQLNSGIDLGLFELGEGLVDLRLQIAELVGQLSPIERSDIITSLNDGAFRDQLSDSGPVNAGRTHTLRPPHLYGTFGVQLTGSVDGYLECALIYLGGDFLALLFIRRSKQIIENTPQSQEDNSRNDPFQ